jgi:leucyl/phenylalanyl-tRNA---protein transferase
MQLVLTPELLLEAYKHGLFPMAYSAGSPYIHWICPEKRGQLPIAELHIPKRLEYTVRHAPYEIRINTAFKDVVAACAEPTEKRPETWINDQIAAVYGRLFELGHGHSVECWKDDRLVGGIYGLAIGGAFFGESMFSRARDASKVALVHTAARLWKGGFTLFDTQFINDHLKQFGAYELEHKIYQGLLTKALQKEGDFLLEGMDDRTIVEEYLSGKNKN